MKTLPDISDAPGRRPSHPAHPLALTANRTLDERRQRALARYYLASGAAASRRRAHHAICHTRSERRSLSPVLELAAEVMDERRADCIRIAGAIGPTAQAVAEAELAMDLGYHAVCSTCRPARRR